MLVRNEVMFHVRKSAPGPVHGAKMSMFEDLDCLLMHKLVKLESRMVPDSLLTVHLVFL